MSGVRSLISDVWWRMIYYRIESIPRPVGICAEALIRMIYYRIESEPLLTNVVEKCVWMIYYRIESRR